MHSEVGRSLGGNSKAQDTRFVTKEFDGLVLMVICDLLDLKNNGALKKKE